MRVHLVDPPAFTPPYDHALAARPGAAAGAEVRADHQPLRLRRRARPRRLRAARAVLPPGAVGAAGSRARRLSKLAAHVPDMLRYRRRAARRADVVHFQWLTAPRARRAACCRAARSC